MTKKLGTRWERGWTRKNGWGKKGQARGKPWNAKSLAYWGDVGHTLAKQKNKKTEKCGRIDWVTRPTSNVPRNRHERNLTRPQTVVKAGTEQKGGNRTNGRRSRGRTTDI